MCILGSWVLGFLCSGVCVCIVGFVCGLRGGCMFGVNLLYVLNLTYSCVCLRSLRGCSPSGNFFIVSDFSTPGFLFECSQAARELLGAVFCLRELCLGCSFLSLLSSVFSHVFALVIAIPFRGFVFLHALTPKS